MTFWCVLPGPKFYDPEICNGLTDYAEIFCKTIQICHTDTSYINMR